MKTGAIRGSGWNTQQWNVPAQLNFEVGAFIVLFALSVWFLASGLWTQNPEKKNTNFLLFIFTFVPALLLITKH